MSKVINLEDYEFTFRESPSRFPRENDRCLHRRFTLDDHGQTVHCADCGDQLSAYWMLNEIPDAYVKKMAELEKLRQKAQSMKDDLDKEHKFLRVLRDVQSAWRGKRKMAVCCPHCGIGILPEDGLGRERVSPEYNLVLKRERDKRLAGKN